jgi:hypothetical protein
MARIANLARFHHLAARILSPGQGTAQELGEVDRPERLKEEKMNGAGLCHNDVRTDAPIETEI